MSCTVACVFAAGEKSKRGRGRRISGAQEHECASFFARRELMKKVVVGEAPYSAAAAAAVPDFRRGKDGTRKCSAVFNKETRARKGLFARGKWLANVSAYLLTRGY